MTEAEILARLTAICRSVFNDPALAMTLETTADDIEAWDSVTHIRLVLEVERAFGVAFRTAELETLKNVGDLVRLVIAKTAAKG